MLCTPESRQHRKVSALAFRLLAAGKVSAYEYACHHQDSWTNPRLTPEAALERSLVGFVQPRREKSLHAGEAEAAAKMARVCEQPAPWDKKAEPS